MEFIATIGGIRSMRNYVGIFSAVLCSLTMSAGIWTAGSVASAGMGARSVSLADAEYAPTMLHLIRAHRAYTPPTSDVEGAPCPGGTWYSDIGAYQWNGRALGPQRWSGHLRYGGGIGYYWNAPSGRVEFDGLTFYNSSPSAVLVAGWCE